MKIDIISGFLGAGKTTLIKKLIQETFKEEKIALIENEFGEIGIDGGFLKESGINITEMNSGCICCTLVGDFDKNLREVIDTYHPDRIIIEPSGVGKLSDVMKSVMDIEKTMDVELNSLAVVVNAKKAVKQMRSFGEFFENQIEHATTIILSRTADIDQKKLEECIAEIKRINSNAIIITTPWEQLDGNQLLEIMEGQESLEKKLLAEEHAHHHHHHHHEQDGCCCGGDHDHEHGEDGCCCGGDYEHDHEHNDGCCCGGDHEHDHEHNDGCCCGGDHEHDHEHNDGCEDHDHAHHADEIFSSWGMETPHKFEKSVIEATLRTLVEAEEFEHVLRAKGIVETTDGSWIYFDMVPGEFELREGQPDYTGRLCVIGTQLKEEQLSALFGI
ncbi:MAG: CobW family GTP-binding protein [Lachnospiraceae bacterium]